MGRQSRGKKPQKTPPQESRGKRGQNNVQNCDLSHRPNNRPGEKYVSSAGRPLQGTKSSQHQRTYQETVHVNCNQRSNGRSPSRPALTEHASVQPRQVSNAHFSRTKTNNPINTNNQVTQTRDNSNDSPKGRRKRRRRSRKLQPKDEKDQERTQEKSQSKILVSNNIESSQTTKPVIYYAIRNGAYNYYGVHTDWNVCVRYLKGAPGATFKSFTDEEEAFEFAHGDFHQVTRPKKKLKQEELHQTPKVNGQDTIELQAEKRASSKEVELSTRSRRQHRQATRIEPRAKVGSPSINGFLSRDPQPLPLKVEGDSVEEAEKPQICQTSTQTQQVPSSEPSSEVLCVEDVSVQPWKIEPVLLPTTLFPSEANRVPVRTVNVVKKEELLAQAGPRKNSRTHVR